VASARELARACDGHPFLRPLGCCLAATLALPDSLSVASLGAKEGSEGAAAASCGAGAARAELPEAVAEPLPDGDKLACLLAAVRCPEGRLEVALSTHCDPDVREQLLARGEEALAAVLDGGEGGAAEALARWRSCCQEFCTQCRVAWELHEYLVLLDAKGDGALLELALMALCELLEVPAAALGRLLARTRPWVEAALRTLAAKSDAPRFERVHRQTLGRWRDIWHLSNSIGAAADEELRPGQRFWESYFVSWCRISWPDYLEAFEHFYSLGRCPADLEMRLRARLDPGHTHLVSRSAWFTLVREHGTVRRLVDALADEVLSDTAPLVYCELPDNEASDGVIPTKVEPNVLKPTAGQETSVKTTTVTHCRPGKDSVQPHSLPLLPPRRRPPVVPRPIVGISEGGQTQRHRGTAGLGGSSFALEVAVPWDDIAAAQLRRRCRPWWGSPGEAPALEDIEAEEPLRVAARRAVTGGAPCTRRALVLRIVSGDLAQQRPAATGGGAGRVAGHEDIDGRLDAGGGAPRDGEEAAALPSTPPAVVVTAQATTPHAAPPAVILTAQGTRHRGVVKFGRSSSRRTLLPDCPMGEPIASRSHFNVVYDPGPGRYVLMDAGSKWGTFIRIGTDSVALSCGDWFRVGGVEFVVRFCGGGCPRGSMHAHHRLRSLLGGVVPRGQPHPRRAPRRADLSPPAMLEVASSGKDGVEGSPAVAAKVAGEHGDAASWQADSKVAEGEEGDSCSAAEAEAEAEEQPLLTLCGAGRHAGWKPPSLRLWPQEVEEIATCTAAAVRAAAADETGEEKEKAEASLPPRVSAAADPPTFVPVPPLEIEFISGPRMGEKLALCRRMCTLGCGDMATVQVHDSQTASVSRIHCVIEYRGRQWHLRDNESTNGTWRRLSCVLEPSAPIQLTHGSSVQAGAHEFLVEEVELRRWWLPSAAMAAVESLCKQEVAKATSVGHMQCKQELRQLLEEQAPT